MGMEYDLSAVRILELLGYVPATKKAIIEFEKNNNMKLPRIMSEFLEYATDNPLFSTGDIWSMNDFSFLYRAVEERIEDDKEMWAESPEEYEDDEYFQLSEIPKKDWPDYIDNLLLFGSDYGTGVVTFGINIGDPNEKDPPVYMRHEENSIQDWEEFNENLSEFLKMVFCDILSCVEYSTARDILEGSGWKYQMCEDQTVAFDLLLKRPFDLLKRKMFPSLYGELQEVYCYHDDAETVFYLLRHDPRFVMYIISR